MAPSDQSPSYIVARMVANVGTGFCAGCLLGTSYFTMPGILHPTISAAERVKSFKQLSTRSSFWLSRIAVPATAAYLYIAIASPSIGDDEGFVNAKSLLALAATCMGIVMPYSWFKMSGPSKRLNNAGKAQEVDEEKDMGLQVVDEDMVKDDLEKWTKGDKVRGWMVLSAFLLGSFVEVCYL